jgi:hypothetical protein
MVRNHPPIVWVVLYTVGVLEYPFDSGLRVNADAFELALRER